MIINYYYNFFFFIVYINLLVQLSMGKICENGCIIEYVVFVRGGIEIVQVRKLENIDVLIIVLEMFFYGKCQWCVKEFKDF